MMTGWAVLRSYYGDDWEPVSMRRNRAIAREDYHDMKEALPEVEGYRFRIAKCKVEELKPCK